MKEKNPEYYLVFRRNIRLLRNEKGLSAIEASKEVGLRSIKRYADLEEGRMPPSVSEVIRISDFYKVKIDTLINQTAIITFI
ncbi:helix-turn-helix domain-containing protein [Chitinophaga nivalis]|uniref:Helix-turn-helix transcriptional regulator n=1 Tax=Chitinophaga nivalis TaxID=2991709 RepID=A0ABT3IIH3_9BACT|nr:helix-turn-helix transcriptional regulator [Chitinophaga nivalis]MCW3466539.1 helix-turn-helix transcriptional regulator [Chitinophaga nivalis]MCW3483770.1 helix-turn-helix transcriptional regulator [Chitinophaga nivalis]